MKLMVPYKMAASCFAIDNHCLNRRFQSVYITLFYDKSAALSMITALPSYGIYSGLVAA